MSKSLAGPTKRKWQRVSRRDCISRLNIAGQFGQDEGIRVAAENDWWGSGQTEQILPRDVEGREKDVQMAILVGEARPCQSL